VGGIGKTFTGFFEHGGRAIDAEDLVTDATKGFGDVARSATKIGEDEISGKEVGCQSFSSLPGFEVTCDLVPLRGDPVEERSFTLTPLPEYVFESGQVGSMFGQGCQFFSNGEPETVSQRCIVGRSR
jgi:hypothetical protein